MVPRPDSLARRLALLQNLPQSAANPTLWSGLLRSQIPFPLGSGGRIPPPPSSTAKAFASDSSTAGSAVGEGSSMLPSPSSSSSVSSAAPLTQPFSPPSPLGGVVRHGAGDCVVRLDVGGKEFRTLRSTVALNHVLADLVARAESSGNGELSVRDGKSVVFIDRDPAHFGLILQHLRNKADGVSSASPVSVQAKFRSLARRAESGVSNSTSTYVQLPRDKSKLREFYAEALYFDIKELKEAACYHSFLVWVTSKLGGAGWNPFDVASKLMTTLRRGAVAIAGLTAGASTVQSRDAILDALPEGLKAAVLPFLLTRKEDGARARDEGEVEAVCDGTVES